MRDKITDLQLPKKGDYHHYIIASDFHGKYINESCYQILLSYAKTLPKYQRNLIIAGDFLDAEFLYPKNKDFKKHIKSNTGIEDYFLKQANKEFDLINEILDELCSVFDTITYIEGNHCYRYQRFIDSGHCPYAYHDDFNIEKRLNLKNRNISFVRYNNWLDVGKVAITHGMWNGKDCKLRHHMAAMKSVIFGDIHRAEVEAFVSREGTRKAWTLPAMCNLEMGYMDNRDHNWTNGFGHLVVKHNGNFQFNVHEIWDSELIIGNKILK